MLLPGDLLTPDAFVRFDIVGVTVVVPLVAACPASVTPQRFFDLPCEYLRTVPWQPIRFAFLNDPAYIDGVGDPVFC